MLQLVLTSKIKLEIKLKRSQRVHYAHRIVYCYNEFKLRYLKNQKLFSVIVKELFELIALQINK